MRTTINSRKILSKNSRQSRVLWRVVRQFGFKVVDLCRRFISFRALINIDFGFFGRVKL